MDLKKINFHSTWMCARNKIKSMKELQMCIRIYSLSNPSQNCTGMEFKSSEWMRYQRMRSNPVETTHEHIFCSHDRAWIRFSNWNKVTIIYDLRMRIASNNELDHHLMRRQFLIESVQYDKKCAEKMEKMKRFARNYGWNGY